MNTTPDVRKDGLIITFSGPSGSGKNTISQKVMERDQQVNFLVTATTREPRDFEEDGVHYYFLSQDEFEQKLDDEEFLEHSRHHSNYYGTLKSELVSKLAQGLDPHTDMSWTGARAVKEFLPENTVNFCIMPPSKEVLEERMEKRRQDSGEMSETQAKRLEKALIDMAVWQEDGYVFTNEDMKGSTLKDYDYVAVNRDLEATVQFVLDAIRLERQKRRL